MKEIDKETEGGVRRNRGQKGRNRSQRERSGIGREVKGKRAKYGLCWWRNIQRGSERSGVTERERKELLLALRREKTPRQKQYKENEVTK